MKSLFSLTVSLQNNYFTDLYKTFYLIVYLEKSSAVFQLNKQHNKPR
jgi:hypothetical protein